MSSLVVLLHLWGACRPDISYIVSVVGWYSFYGVLYYFVTTVLALVFAFRAQSVAQADMVSTQVDTICQLLTHWRSNTGL